MRAIRKAGPGEGFEYRDDVADAALGPGDVRLQIAAASVCGTDRELVAYTSAAQSFRPRFPVVLGHEVSGTVIEVGSSVTRLRYGDRVALESHIACGECYFCRVGTAHNCAQMELLGLHVDGGFAERTVAAEKACYKLPDEVPLEVGALFESAGVAVHAYLRSGHRLAGESMLITGGGPIGLVLAQLGQALGAKRVVVVEPNLYRRAMAEKTGAVALSPSDDVVGWCRESEPTMGGFDVGFDCAGAPGAFQTVLESLRREATAVAVGLGGLPVEVDTTKYVIRKGLTIKGSFGRSLWTTWELLASMVSSGRLDLSDLISHRLPLAAFAEALERIRADAAKILLLPSLRD